MCSAFLLTESPFLAGFGSGVLDCPHIGMNQAVDDLSGAD